MSQHSSIALTLATALAVVSCASRHPDARQGFLAAEIVELTPAIVREHATGLARLRFLVGSWARVTPAEDGVASRAAPERLDIQPYLGDQYLRMRGRMDGPAFELLFAYSTRDRRYQLAILDEQSGVFDTYDGDFEADGSLVLTNAQYFRVALQPMPRGGFRWVGSYSRDRGTTWRVTTTYLLESARSDAKPATSPADHGRSEAARKSTAASAAASAAVTAYDRLRFLEGAWTAEPWWTPSSGRPRRGNTMALQITPGLGDRYLEVRGMAGEVTSRIVFSHHSPSGRYRAAVLHGRSAALHVYDGNFDAAGRLVLTSPQHTRITLVRRPDGGVDWIDEASVDGGLTWTTSATYRMSRPH